ncbi:telomerase protein component 1 [Clonorchis sinensis]|uniref:Telomerase protein component 1 n=1 Tax=Clonorchis sinensis TaxID=79923 RepID=G7YLL7_CLOSI|nr:telomerase protein component 1 [Clonorchis sinensis]
MKQRFDTVLVLGPLHAELLEYVRNCREYYGPVNAVWGNLDGSPYRGEPNGAPKDWVMVKGPTDIVLRYIAETSNDSLLEHIERIDELYGLEKTPRIHFVRQAPTDPSLTETEVQIERPISDWRCCRVFISSTFRDMHAERDLLCGLVIPNIRQFAARELRVHVNEVDLRWGVPEPATRSSQSLQMCLEQAYSADIFILLVGERYGWVPKSALVNSLPKPILRQLNKFYTPGMSITEMEYRLAKRSAEQRLPVHVRRNYPNKAHEAVTQRINAFIRAADSLNAVPSLHKLDFEEQNLEKAKRLTAFKELLQKDGVIVLESYPAWFNGVIAHRPVMGNLTELGLKLSQCLHDSLCRIYKATIPTSLVDRSYELPRSQHVGESFLRIFVEPVASAIAPRQLLQLEKAFLELNSRGKQCRTVRLLAAQKISPNPNDRSNAPILSKFSASDGAVLLVTGSSGCGKTTHLAALSMSLSTTKWCPRQSTGHAAFEMADPRAKLLSSQTSRSGAFPFESQRPRLERFIVLPQFVDGLPSTGLAPKIRIADILDCWNELLLADVEAAATRSGCLTKQVDQLKDSTELEGSSFTSSTSSPDALLRFKMLRFAELLKIVGSFVGTRYAFLLDAADHLQPTLFDWLPDVLPENVRFVISCHSDSVAARKLAARPDCLALSIGGLTAAERSAAVRALFGQYGKVLRESTFGNQLSVLVNKRNAEIPLYLRLACDELRLYGTYEELDSQLRALPDTVPKLVQHMIARVETECGSSLTSAALAFMCCSQKPLATDELHVLIDSWMLATRSDPASTPVEDPWYALETDSLPTTGSIADLICREREVESLLNSTALNKSRKVCLPHLAFYTLLSGLRPLLAGMGDESQNNEDEDDEDRVLVAPKGWLRFRSQEIKNHVRDIVFVNKGGSLPAYSRLGFHQTSRTLAQSHTSKRAKLSGFPDMTATTDGKINEEFIHWLLATRLPDLEYKIYHLFHAGKFHIVCRLLTSAVFLTAKFRAGLRSSLLEDFQIEATASVDAQERWLKVCQNDAVKVLLDATRIFVGIHNSVLSRYPFLFGELAINYEVEKSVQQLGLAYLSLTDKSSLSSTGAPSVRLFIRHSCLSDAPVLPVKVSSPSGVDTLTAVAVSPNSSLVVYGDQSGMITVAELGSFRELRSLFGHRGAVCSLCFLTTDTTTSSIMSFNRSGSQYQLASTAQDGSIYLWSLETDSSNSGRLQLSDGSRIASLTGVHRRSVTSVVWHPERQLLATGGLDCLVVIWTLSQAEMGSFQSISRDQSSLPPHRVFGTRFSPINCLAFRLPTGTLMAQSTEHDSLDVLAAGCWDGSVHIYDLCRLRQVRVFSASNFAISAMAYSPNGGHLLATQDVRGQLFLWNSTRYTLLSGFTQVITNPRLCLESGFPDSVNCQRGQLCFTRPNGRYLIQSGNASLQNGYLSVWNAQLGFTICPWRKLDDSLRASVTAFTVDPYNHLLITGSSIGAVSLVCSRTARVIHTAHDLRPGERSRVQCIACHAVSSHRMTGATFLVIIGLSNGLVQIYQFTVKLPRCELQTGSSKGSTYCSCTLVDCRSLRKDNCHSTGDQENLVAHGGGTLCVAIDDKITVSGGGNAICKALVYEYSHKQLVANPHYLHGVDDAVTAVATRNHCVAVASKNRTLRIYRLADDIFFIHVCIPHAANDWITSMIWSDIGCGQSPYSTPLVLGSNDGMVYTYRIYKEKSYRRIQSIGGPGGPITSLSSKGQFIACGSMEGLTRLWRINRWKRLEPLTTLDSTHIGRGDQGPVGTSTTVVLFNEEHMAPPTSDEDVESTKDNMEPIENLETDLEQNKESTRVEDGDDVECGLDALFSPPPEKSDAISVEMKDAANTVSTREKPQSTTSAEPAESESELSSTYHGTSDESETETSISSESDELPRPNTSCLMSVGMNVGATVSDTFDATNLRLVIGLETIIPSGVSKSSVDPYHYRIVAPFLPERLALAQGHSGVSATGLAAVDTFNDEAAACFVSVAKKQHTNQIAADIRHWCLPIPQDCPAPVAEHTGAVTCMSRFWSTNPVGWCASGAEDGRVVFRRSVQKTIAPRTDPSPLELANLLQNSSWLVAFSISFFYDPVQPIVPISSLHIVSVPQAHFVYVAAGKMVWLLIIPDTMMSVLETLSTCTVNDLEGLTNPDSRCADRIRVLSLSFSDAIIELCPLLEPTSPSSDCFYLLASFGNASLMQLTHNNSFPSFDSKNGPKLSSLELSSSACWATCWHPFGTTSAVGLASNTPIIVSKHEENLTLQQLWPDAKLDLLGNIKYIEPVGDLPVNGHRECYLVVALSHEVYTSYLIDRQCVVLAKSEPVLPPITVTAVCTLRDANNRASPTVDEKALQMLVATSDGILHLLELDYEQSFSVSAPVSLRQVGLYPTGNHVTNVQLLRVDPLQVLVGSQTGRMDVFSIV